MNPLAMTGTAALLEQLSPHVPDELIDGLWARRGGRGRRPAFCASQLFRVMLLALLTPAHSFNLLLELLPEHRAWRRFARLRHRHRLPDAKMLHQFRDALHLSALRQINHHLLKPLIDQVSGFSKTLALIDSTDLPASTRDKKKRAAAIPPGSPRSADAALKADTRAILSVTKSTPCGCGCGNIQEPSCWHRWSPG